MYNQTKNIYLIYIISYMSSSSIYILNINNALKDINGNDTINSLTYNTDPDNIIIKNFIDKLKVMDKKPLSITKYNYNYYLNDCDEEKEQMLFNKIFIFIIASYADFTRENAIQSILILWELLIKNIKDIYKIYKNFKHNTDFNFLFSITETLIGNDSNYNVDEVEHIKLLLKLSNINYNYDNKTLTINNTDAINRRLLILFRLAFISNYINNDINYYKILNRDITYENINELLIFLLTISKDYNQLLIELPHIKVENIKLDEQENKYNFKSLDSNLFNLLNEACLSNKDYFKNALVFFNKYKGNYIKLEKIFEDTFKPKEYEYLIINKDKQIIDLLKEFPEIEENYNIDNNSIELYELSRKIIILNDTNYELFGYIAADNKYIKVNTVVVDPAAAPAGAAGPDSTVDTAADPGSDDGGASAAGSGSDDGGASVAGSGSGDGGDGAGAAVGSVVDDADVPAAPGGDAVTGGAHDGTAGSDAVTAADGAAADGDLSQLSKAKLLIYCKKDIKSLALDNHSKDPQEIILKTKEECKNNTIDLKEDSKCNNIKLNWNANSCYIDSIFVLLFSVKHKYMDDLLYNLKIKTEYQSMYKYPLKVDEINLNLDITYSENDKKKLYFYASKIKNELIYLYNNISMKIFQESCNLDNIRNNISLYCKIFYKYDSINVDNIKEKDLADKYTIEYIKNELINKWKNKQLSYLDLFNILNIIFHETFKFNLIYNETKYNLYKDSLETYLQSKYDIDIDNIKSNDIKKLNIELEEISKKISNEINNDYYYTIAIDSDLNMDDNYKLILYEEDISIYKSLENNNIHWIKDENNGKLYTTYKIKKEININLQKSLLIMFNNITNKKIITEKLYLDDSKINSLSLQSILFYNAGNVLEGSDVSSGHYMCMFKCNNKWYLFNPSPTPILTEYENYNDYINEQRSKYITGLYYI